MFNVSWMESAVQSIMAAFERADADGQQVLDRCIVRFEALLTHDPHHFGESREGPIRIGFWNPCAIYFIVDDPAEGEVRILDFWLTSNLA